MLALGTPPARWPRRGEAKGTGALCAASGVRLHHGPQAVAPATYT